jgi:site-specific DNA-methyltransferase (adenine-specific)
MGKSWDATGVAYSVELWQEVMRVLKPGGHLLAFSGSRTYHRMAVAIEDAGFEIRDQIMWIYGSGFPKSHDVSKGIDKRAGAEREVVGEKITGRALGGSNWKDGDAGGQEFVSITIPATAEAKQWQGWGTALKPAHEPIVVARKPLIGTVAANVLTYGTGGLNIDASRVGDGEDRASGGLSGGATDANLYQHGTHGRVERATGGRWPANVIHDGSDEVVELFPDSKGGAFPAKRGQAINTSFASGQETEGGFRAMGDSGSAARFFYCAKASKRDRNEGLDGLPSQRRAGLQGADNDKDNLDPVSERWRTQPSANHHPTVKPTELMRYLCRLVTPPKGIVLDPFMGSGSTGKAAMYEGFEFVGIELTDEYLPIAKARIEFAIEEMKGRLL